MWPGWFLRSGVGRRSWPARQSHSERPSLRTPVGDRRRGLRYPSRARMERRGCMWRTSASGAGSPCTSRPRMAPHNTNSTPRACLVSEKTTWYNIIDIIHINTTAIRGLLIVYFRFSRYLRAPTSCAIGRLTSRRVCCRVCCRLSTVSVLPAYKRCRLSRAGEAGFLPISAGKNSIH